MDRDGDLATISFQNSYDLGAAKRRQLHALVGPGLQMVFAPVTHAAP